MTLKQTIDVINSKAVDELQRDKSGNGFVCPICNSGEGKNGTGITTKDNIHFTCWAGCFTNESYIDILARKNGIDPSNKKESLENAFRIYGFSFKDFGFEPPRNQQQKQAETVQNNTEQKTDYSKFFAKCHKAVTEPAPKEYLKSRGITDDVINRFKIGYCEGIQGINAIIFPTGKNSYIARNIADDCDKGNRYRKSKGEYRLFNFDILDKAETPIFITEGEFDALSIIQGGGNAVALGGLANLDKVILRAQEIGLKQPLIIALDNDEQGKRKADELKGKEKELEQAGLKIYFPDVNRLYNGNKDANEALVENDFYFPNIVKDVIEEANNLDEVKRKEAEIELSKDSVLNARKAFDETIEKSKTASFIPTGFTNLDNLLDGGLFAGLYILGAVSSLGKTTFCLQIADQIARQKNDVLIFSLEMSRMELIAKSISRLTSVIDLERTQSNTNAKTTRGILTGSKYSKYNPTELNLIDSAKDMYFREYAPNIYIYEGIGNIGVAQIRKKIEQFKTIKGKAPIAVIDYLQILAPAPDSRYNTDKQNTDYNVMELKRISRDFETAIIGISSFNRDNYNAPVNMASFKESGAIEYSSDVLIGLQYKEMQGLKDNNTDKAKAAEIYAAVAEKARNKQPIDVQLKILKNRNGAKGTAEFEFYPMFNKFKEAVDNGEWHK